MTDEKKLYLEFHGRIIDSLGIQMYQSPVAAISELIANAWDADARSVRVALPENLSGAPVIKVADNGIGMTFRECQTLYLSVGRNRRSRRGGGKSPGGRPVLGRKGIGKFAGFGIADVLEVATVSAETGERTVFELDLARLRGNEEDDYVSTDAKQVEVLERSRPNDDCKAEHGTIVTLRNLTLGRIPNRETFAKSLARRFLIAQTADEFSVDVDGLPLPDENALRKVQFDFPKDYRNDEKPSELRIENDEGIERVGDHEIRWRIRFTEGTIDTEELRGVSVFCGIKIAQTPFFFNLSGGLSGHHGQQYLTGRVQADFLDQLGVDVITTERQRVNWELDQALPLLEWGQNRVKSLLAIWKKRRAEDKIRLIEEKLASFSDRLDRLKATERRTVRNALVKLASIEALSNEQFEDLSASMLTAWEDGRLRELINDVSNVEEMDESGLLNLLAEAQILNALHVAEAVKAKVEIVNGLSERIKAHELENAVRDYIAENPWLISPQWETFRKETKIDHLLAKAANEAELDKHDEWRGRVDLVLSSGRQLLVIEFMRPGLTVDWDHIARYQRYMYVLRSLVIPNNRQVSDDIGYSSVSGLLVADNLGRPQGMERIINVLERDDMGALEWRGLLSRAAAQWSEFLGVLVDRAPNDDRLSNIHRR